MISISEFLNSWYYYLEVTFKIALIILFLLIHIPKSQPYLYVLSNVVAYIALMLKWAQLCRSNNKLFKPIKVFGRKEISNAAHFFIKANNTCLLKTVYYKNYGLFKSLHETFFLAYFFPRSLSISFSAQHDVMYLNFTIFLNLLESKLFKLCLLIYVQRIVFDHFSFSARFAQDCGLRASSFTVLGLLFKSGSNYFLAVELI